MISINFVDKVTQVPTTWLQSVNDFAVNAQIAGAGKGAALIADVYDAAGATDLDLHSFREDDGSYNVMGFIPAAERATIRARTSTYDASTAINLALSRISTIRGGGALRFPAGKFNLGSAIVGVNGVGIVGEGPGATSFYVTGVNNGIVYGDGVTQFLNVILRGFEIIGTVTSGVCLYGKILTDSCSIQDVYTTSGSVGVKLDSCYSLGLENVRVRSAVGNGIECNAVTNNTNLHRVKVQICGGHGLYTTGCLALTVADSNFEFNAQDQINVATGRGITLRDNYFEGIAPRASGFAGIQVVAADVVNITGGLFDATQTGVLGTDGTGTYVKVSGASSRVHYRDYGFASIASTQTHVNFGATALNSDATVPLGSTYSNSAPSCRVYNDDFDERGVVVYNTAVQAYTFNAWNGLVIDTEQVDAKGEWASNQFTPKDYGFYQWTVDVGIAALGAGKDFQVRLFNVTDAFQIAELSFTNTGAGATTRVDLASFGEILVPGKAYQVQLFNNDIANRNSVAGASTARQTIKRSGRG